MRFGVLIGAGFAATALSACGAGETTAEAEATTEETEVVETLDAGALLDEVIAGDHRSEEEVARDQYRNPKETLLFLGIEPDMKVVEIWPGGGWYTQILAPYLKAGGGTYYAAGFVRDESSDYVMKAITRFETDYVSKPEIYGDIVVTSLGGEEAVAPEGTADAVLTFRNLHNWQGRGFAEAYFAEFYKALKPGGVLGVIEHRADGNDELPRDGSSGYAFVADAVALAEGAGFELVAQSEINANPNDTKDHPFGVWTLPPVKRSSAARGEEDPSFDRAAYDAIGESDRMTLKFQKPLAADGALLE